MRAGVGNRNNPVLSCGLERITDLLLTSSSLVFFFFFPFKLKSGWESPVLLDSKPVTNQYKHTSGVQEQSVRTGIFIYAFKPEPQEEN